ncbi:peptidylprolyl isomerase [Roseivirga echinicomitans]
MRTTKFINKGLAAILLTVLSLNLTFGQEVVDKIVAKVDNHIILKSELEQAYAGFLSRGDASNFTGDARCMILEQMIETKLMLAMSELDSVDIEPGRVDYELDMRMQNMLAQFGSERVIQETYGKSVDQLKNELRPNIEEQLKIGAQEDNILSSVTVTPAEIRAFFNKIPKDSLPLFNTEFEIAIIIKKPVPNDAEVQKAKDQLMKIRERAMKGENFEILAIENSQGPTGPNGGNLGFAKRGQMDPAYEAGALALKPGEISMPVVSSFGIHLIQLVEKRGNEYNSRHIIIIPQPTQQDIQKSADVLDSLRTLILSDSISFAAAAKQYSDDEGTKVNGGFLSGPYGSNKMPADALEPTMFFKIDEMTVGEVSEAEIIDMPDGTKAAQIVFFKSKVKPHKANMTDDYEKLKAATLGMKKELKRSEYIKEKMKEVYVMVDPEFNRCGITNDN